MELTNPLEKAHVDETCKIGKGTSCCRYLTVSAKGFECAKHSSLKRTLDMRAEQLQMVARADNCDGVRPPEPEPVPLVPEDQELDAAVDALISTGSDDTTESDDDDDTTPDTSDEPWSGDGGEFNGAGASGDW